MINAIETKKGQCECKPNGMVVEADLDSGEFTIKYPDVRIVSGRD